MYIHYPAVGKICCFTMWAGDLSLRQMLKAASCHSPGDIFTMSMDNIELYGNTSALFVSKHPEVHHKAGKRFTKCPQVFAGNFIRDWT